MYFKQNNILKNNNYHIYKYLYRLFTCVFHEFNYFFNANKIICRPLQHFLNIKTINCKLKIIMNIFNSSILIYFK